MTKIDFKKTDKPLYSGKSGRWDRVQVPPMSFLAIDGQGDPAGADYGAALAALYPLAYAVKFDAKSNGQDFVVPPLEALWWSSDLNAFTANLRDKWQWRVMLRMPDFVTADDVVRCSDVTAAKLTKKGLDTGLIRAITLTPLDEGDALQILHVGAYTDEGPTLSDLHDRLMPESGLTFNGPHHEIYLSDPRRVTADKLRTILRQPVKISQ